MNRRSPWDWLVNTEAGLDVVVMIGWILIAIGVIGTLGYLGCGG